MKRLTLILAACALPLSGCAAIVPALGLLNGVVSATKPSAAVGDKVVLEGKRGLILAHNAYQGATAIVTPLVAQHLFNADQLTMIQSLSDNAVKLLEGADATLTEAQRAAGVFTIVNQLNDIASTASGGSQ